MPVVAVPRMYGTKQRAIFGGDRGAHNWPDSPELTFGCALIIASECALNSYLPGSGDTVIMKAVPPGRGPSIALRLG